MCFKSKEERARRKAEKAKAKEEKLAKKRGLAQEEAKEEEKPAPKAEVKEEKVEAPQEEVETEEEENEEAEEEKGEAKERAKSTKKVYHISYRKEDGMWQVKLGGKKVLKLFNTQEEGIKYAKALADSQEGSIVIHMKDGTIRKQKY